MIQTQTKTTTKSMQQVLRKEPGSLNIIPYMRSTTRTLGVSSAKTEMSLMPWDNQGGWSDCWHNDWQNGWHNGWHNSSVRAKGVTAEILSDAISVREDGFIFNRMNRVIFRADDESREFLISLKDVAIPEIAQNYPKVIEMLWLN
jgi:hypothetical protein